MLSPFRLTVAASLMLAAGLVNAGVQGSQGKDKPPAKRPAAPAAAVTTASGIYSAQQAMRGEMTYMNLCVGCHPVGTYAAPSFREKWNGQTMSQLFEFVAETMPKNDPGSLQPDEYADVLAYILRVNGAPAGQKAMPGDPAPLRKIKIDLRRR